jgi:hypothetical protein
MPFDRRGPVTLDNIEHLPGGLVKCPISTNSHTSQSHFIIQKRHLDTVLGRCFYVHNDEAYKKKLSIPHYTIRCFQKHPTTGIASAQTLNTLLFHVTRGTQLQVDHVNPRRWFDYSKGNIQFLTPGEHIRKTLGIQKKSRRASNAG